MDKKRLSRLVCPRCKGPLSHHKRLRELHCAHDRLAFPIRDAVPVLLLSDARPLDD